MTCFLWLVVGGIFFEGVELFFVALVGFFLRVFQVVAFSVVFSVSEGT